MGEFAVHAHQFLGGKMPDFSAALGAADNIAMAFQCGKTAPGAGIDGPLQKFCIFTVMKLAGHAGFIHIQFFFNDIEQLFTAHGIVFFRFDDAADIAAHFALADHVAPPGLDTVATFNPENSHRQTQLLGQGCNGRAHVQGFAVEGAVTFRGDADGAALPGHFDTGFHSLDVCSLLADGNGFHQPADQVRYLAHGENILCGQIIDRPPEGQSHEKLVIAGLMIYEDQIGPVTLIFEFFDGNAVFPSYIGAKKEMNQIDNRLVAGFQPLLCVLHNRTSCQISCYIIIHLKAEANLIFIKFF